MMNMTLKSLEKSFLENVYISVHRNQVPGCLEITEPPDVFDDIHQYQSMRQFEWDNLNKHSNYFSGESEVYKILIEGNY